MKNFFTRHTLAAFIAGFVFGPIFIIEGFGAYTAYQIHKRDVTTIDEGHARHAALNNDKAQKAQEWENLRKYYASQKSNQPVEVPASPVVPSVPQGNNK